MALSLKNPLAALRGLRENLPSILPEGFVAWTRDTGEVFFGTGNGIRPQQIDAENVRDSEQNKTLAERLGALDALATFPINSGTAGQFVGSSGNGGAVLKRASPFDKTSETEWTSFSALTSHGAITASGTEGLRCRDDQGQMSVRLGPVSETDDQNAVLNTAGNLTFRPGKLRAGYGKFALNLAGTGDNPSIFQIAADSGNDNIAGSYDRIFYCNGNTHFVGVGTEEPSARLEVAGLIKVGRYTVATLPTAPGEAAQAYAVNGLKTGEPAGSGSGVPVYFSNGWRVTGTDKLVEA